MAKSQQTFSKVEKEKKRLKKREDKRKKMEARKLERQENGTSGIEFAYVDYNGNLVDTPPDPSQKVEIEIEDIAISIPKTLESEREAFNPVRIGVVNSLTHQKVLVLLLTRRIKKNTLPMLVALLTKSQKETKFLLNLRKVKEE